MNEFDPRREPPDDYVPPAAFRLQEDDHLWGKMWIGSDGDPKVQSVFQSASSFRIYVNALLNKYGHIPYGELK